MTDRARVTCYRCDPPYVGEWFEIQPTTAGTQLGDAFDAHVAEVHTPATWLIGRDVEPARHTGGRPRTGKARYAGS